MTAAANPIPMQKYDDRPCRHVCGRGTGARGIFNPWIKKLMAPLALSGETGCWRFPLRVLALLVLVTSTAQAGTWKKADVPSYAKPVQTLAIDDDGRFYSVSSNRHGYFFQSVLATYRFEAATDKDQDGRLLARHNIIFLADTCDAYTPERSGRWTRRGAPGTYRLTIAGNQAITFHLLSEGPQPRHGC